MKTIPRMVLYSSILAVAWIGSIAFGMRVFGRSESASGKISSVPAKFPKDAALTLASDRPTLVLLADPRRADTRATLDELAQVMTELKGTANAYVLFSRSLDAIDSELWNKALAIPGVTPVGDGDGIETRRFGGETSGQTLVFAPNGRLLFSGGMTQLRGADSTTPRALVAR